MSRSACSTSKPQAVDRNTDFITEIGAIKVRVVNASARSRRSSTPGGRSRPSITVLTGISDAMVLPAPRVEQVLPSLLEFCRDSVIVGHNVRFDVAFLNAALARSKRPCGNTVIDTLALARRLVRDEVPDCRLATLARRFRPRPPAEPSCTRRRAGHGRSPPYVARTGGVLRRARPRRPAAAPAIGGHPQVGQVEAHQRAAAVARRLPVPRPRGDVLYVGKATNLRQRVRSYFGSDDRRKIGPMLARGAPRQSCRNHRSVTAGVLELRYLHQLSPRYNRRARRGTVLLRPPVAGGGMAALGVVKDPKPQGLHLGPLPSRTMAGLVIEAIQSAAPLRRCRPWLGRNYVAPPGAARCTAAQLGVAECPCSGTSDARPVLGRRRHGRPRSRQRTTGAPRSTARSHARARSFTSFRGGRVGARSRPGVVGGDQATADDRSSPQRA